MTEYLGIKKTLDRVVSEILWPGVCGDVARFCKFCDICQRTIQKCHITRDNISFLQITPFQSRNLYDIFKTS